MILQAAALAISEGKICLVTSRSGKRWVIPKGCLEPGKSEAQIAVQEAWEEAGISGSLSAKPIGVYRYRKWDDELSVVVFRLDVSEIAEHWPECDVRQRAWLKPAEAAERLDEAKLRAIVRKTFPNE